MRKKLFSFKWRKKEERSEGDEVWGFREGASKIRMYLNKESFGDWGADLSNKEFNYISEICDKRLCFLLVIWFADCTKYLCPYETCGLVFLEFIFCH